MATDLAEAVSLATATDYRSAYRDVGRAVAGGNPLDPAAFGVDPSVLDPHAALATRTVSGGAAPGPMNSMLAECRTAIAFTSERVSAERDALGAAERDLLAQAS
jgi:argininosuccinate lyase